MPRKKEEIHPNVITRVVELYGRGWSRAKIEKTLGIARVTVLKIIPADRERLDPRYMPDPGNDPGNSVYEETAQSGYERCPGCGHKVLIPCLFCTLVEDGAAKQIDDTGAANFPRIVKGLKDEWYD